MRPELSPRQKEALDWIRWFISQNSLPPTVREVGRALGIKSSSTFAILKALQNKKYLRRTALGPRSLEIIGEETRPPHCNCVQVPIVGRIAAGEPILAVENIDDTLTVDKSLVGSYTTFALKVRGDSMVDAGILDGDVVIVRQQETAENGDIVVALIDDEATLKKFYREGRRVRLEPANSNMKPIYVNQRDFRLQGKVLGVHRVLHPSGSQ